MPSKVNGPEDVAQVGAGVTEPVGRLHQPGEHRRRHLVHLARAGRRRHDVGAGHELVAVAVVAVGVGVHDRADRRGRRRHGPQVVEHLLGEHEVEQRVDEQRRVAVGDQAGVRPAPAAVGLEVGPQPVADLVGAPLVAHQRSVEGEVEAAHRPGEDVRLDVGRRDDPQVRPPLGEGAEEQAQLEPGQVGADAEVGALPEGEVRVRVAPDVEGERLVEHVLVAVGARVGEHHPVAGRPPAGRRCGRRG